MRVFIVVFLSLLLFLNNGFLLNDEMLVVQQVKSIENGFKINVEELVGYTGTPWFEINGSRYAPFSYLLPVLAYPIYGVLLYLNNFGYPDLLLALIPPAGFIILSLKIKRCRGLSFAFFAGCVLLFRPVYLFEDWAAIFALKLVNILATSLTAEIMFRIFKEETDENSALSSAILLTFATPLAYWTLSAKLHALTLLTIATIFYSLKRHLKSNDDRYLLLASFLSGFCFFLRAMDGLIISASIILWLIIFKREKLIYTASIALGYLPCALFGYLVFGIPLPVEVVGNVFSNVTYVKASTLNETLFMTPLVLFGLNNNTFGILNYSPILASLVLPLIGAINKKSFYHLNEFEKFLLFFTFMCILLYLPYLKVGVVDTGVRDYRFLLPIYLTLMYFIAVRIKPEIALSSALMSLSCFLISMIVVSILLHQFLEKIYLGILVISIILNIVFVFINRFERREEVFSLAFFSTVFFVSDVIMGYFSPYDIHFTNPILNSFVEILMWIHGSFI